MSNFQHKADATNIDECREFVCAMIDAAGRGKTSYKSAYDTIVTSCCFHAVREFNVTTSELTKLLKRTFEAIEAGVEIPKDIRPHKYQGFIDFARSHHNATFKSVNDRDSLCEAVAPILKALVEIERKSQQERERRVS